MIRKTPETPDGEAGSTFARLLDNHLRGGTRLNATPGKPGRRWTNEAFAKACGTNERSVRFWREGRHCPNDLRPIERALFGDGDAHAEGRQELSVAYDAARDARVVEADVGDRLATRPNEIPAPARCLGRGQEIAELTAALAAPHAAVLVLGGPGIGKTTLTRAVATADALTARFAERRWFVPLETAFDAAALRTAIVLALGGNPADPAAFDHALARLREAPGLLLLDNLETPWEADKQPVQDTLSRLAALPGLALLASLRGNVAPASPAWSHVTELPPLADDPACALFLGFARKIRPDDPCLVPFLRELGGVPLAIELVARRAEPHDRLAGLWQDWQTRGIALARDPDLLEGRLTSVLRSIDLSLHSTRLHPEGSGLLALLGLSPAGMARADQVALLGDDATEAARQALAIGLAVSRDERLDLLPPVRDAVRRLAPATEAVTDRWCRHYLGLVRDLGRCIWNVGGSFALERLSPEMANIEAALHGSLSLPRLSASVEALNGAWRLMSASGGGAVATICKVASACRATNDIAGEASCILRIGEIALARSDLAAAHAAFERALSLFESANDLHGIASSTRCLGNIAVRRSDCDTAERLLADALQRHQSVGDTLGEAICVRYLGNVAARRSDLSLAKTLYEKALCLACGIADILGQASCTRSLGDIALRAADYIAASTEYGEALPLFRRIGDARGEANCVLGLADTALARGDHATAETAYERALPAFRKIGWMFGEANCIRGLGDIARERGDLELAYSHYESARALYARIPDQYNVGATSVRLAELSDGAERASHVAAAREAWGSIDRPDLVAWLSELD